MSAIISEIEAHARAALPALNTEFYDGWQLRFANGHTRRANSVNFIQRSSLPLDKKISYCETAYEQNNQPCHFRLTPLADSNLDALLSSSGYSLSDPTNVLIQPLKEITFSKRNADVVIEKGISIEGVDAIASLTGLSPKSHIIFRKMLERTECNLLLATVKSEDKIVACGLGALSDTYLGLFEFATDPEFRRRGYAAAMVQGLFEEAVKVGAETAYLQAVQSNVDGISFWNKMGFKNCLYSYHYRSKL
ncbi:MAG: GNAT family N-acetyltransferase [Sneathiella sp.]